MSTLGSKLRAAGVSPVLVHEAEKMAAQLGESESGKSYWFRKATELQEELDVIRGNTEASRSCG